MLNAKAFANAVTIVTAIFYVGCWILSALIPDLIFSVAQSWAHSISLESIRSTATMNTGTILFGLVSISAITWVITYKTIWLYNKLAKK